MKFNVYITPVLLRHIRGGELEALIHQELGAVTVTKTECCTIEVTLDPVEIIRGRLQEILVAHLRPDYASDIEVSDD